MLTYTLLQVIELLTKAGANVDHESKEGITPIMMADQNGHEELVEFLVERGAKLAGYNQQSWGGYFKSIFTRAWSQSVRSVSLSIPEEQADKGEMKQKQGKKGGDGKGRMVEMKEMKDMYVKPVKKMQNKINYVAETQETC